MWTLGVSQRLNRNPGVIPGDADTHGPTGGRYPWRLSVTASFVVTSTTSGASQFASLLLHLLTSFRASVVTRPFWVQDAPEVYARARGEH